METAGYPTSTPQQAVGNPDLTPRGTIVISLASAYSGRTGTWKAGRVPLPRRTVNDSQSNGVLATYKTTECSAPCTHYRYVLM